MSRRKRKKSKQSPAEFLSESQESLRDHRLLQRNKELTREKKLLIDRLHRAHEQLELALAIRHPSPPPAIKSRARKRTTREAAPVVIASDWHVEETVFPERVSGRNAYNLEVADRSISEFFEGVLWKLDHAAKAWAIPQGVFALLGDMITGYIHEELLETNGLSPTEAILWLQQRLIRGFDRLLKESPVERWLVPCVHGNHGRISHRTKVKTGSRNSLEWLMYHSLRQHYEQEERLAFHVADGNLVYLQVFDWTLRFLHGDSLRDQGGVGGLTIPLNKAVSAWDRSRPADLTMLGHWHQFHDAGRAVVNGSLIGWSEYSEWIKAIFEPPQQAFFLLDRSRGKTEVSPIWVSQRVT